ncbi:uncharacterized protein VTP21DRAFT_10524 [Calcarisporiella thermophila]|uniref:uncharacterized protein n=1 Tax=Calcarisporiella thermophila TaxID=911321 RepID=UPI003744130D
MGQSNTKDHAKPTDDTIDGGSLTPQGVYSTPQDYDVRVVRRLITERKLAPFYKGLNESNDPGGVSPKENAGKGAGVLSKKEKIEKALYKSVVECPICFLYYPHFINRSRCCDQTVCTECFVQIKRPPDGSPTACPFCVEPNFGVIYVPPDLSAILGENAQNSSAARPRSHTLPLSSSSRSSKDKPRRKSLSHKDPSVVTTDQIRPDWARQHQLAASANSHQRGGSGNSRRIIIRPERLPNSGGYLAAMYRMDLELEELMVMEAIRLSLLEAEARQENAGQNENENSNENENEHGRPETIEEMSTTPESGESSETRSTVDEEERTEDLMRDTGQARSEDDDGDSDASAEAGVGATNSQPSTTNESSEDGQPSSSQPQSQA